MLELLNTSKTGLKKKVLILVIAAFCAANVMAQDFTMQEQVSVLIVDPETPITSEQYKSFRSSESADRCLSLSDEVQLIPDHVPVP